MNVSLRQILRVPFLLALKPSVREQILLPKGEIHDNLQVLSVFWQGGHIDINVEVDLKPGALRFMPGSFLQATDTTWGFTTRDRIADHFVMRQRCGKEVRLSSRQLGYEVEWTKVFVCSQIQSVVSFISWLTWKKMVLVLVLVLVHIWKCDDYSFHFECCRHEPILASKILWTLTNRDNCNRHVVNMLTWVMCIMQHQFISPFFVRLPWVQSKPKGLTALFNFTI